MLNIFQRNASCDVNVIKIVSLVGVAPIGSLLFGNQKYS